MEVVSGDNFTGAIRRAKLQSNHHHQHTNTQYFYRLDALPVTPTPCSGYGVIRIDPLRFLAGCRTRRLNQALSVLSLSLGFL